MGIRANAHSGPAGWPVVRGSQACLAALTIPASSLPRVNVTDVSLSAVKLLEHINSQRSVWDLLSPRIWPIGCCCTGVRLEDAWEVVVELIVGENSVTELDLIPGLRVRFQPNLRGRRRCSRRSTKWSVRGGIG